MIMPGTTPDGSWVLYVNIDSKVKHFNFCQCVKIVDMIVSVNLLKNGTCTGLFLLVDIDGFGFHHFIKISPSAFKKSMIYFRVSPEIQLIEMNL